jgi:hypothetical protein
LAKTNLIISASRRTDIPALYAEWFINRVRAGWCQVPNPLDLNKLSYVSLRPDDVDVIVFWSKNPEPLVKYFNELDQRGFHYYFQYTLNDYPKILEPSIPVLDARIMTFRKISDLLEPRRIIWRYDPIIISNKTPPSFHEDKFLHIAQALRGSTKRVIVSLVDYYRKTDRRLLPLHNMGYSFNKRAVDSGSTWDLMKALEAIASQNGMKIFTCAEDINFSAAGVLPGKCIDGELIGELWSLSGHTQKDPHQRASCLCAISKDIGINDTCIHGCPYCYSTGNLETAQCRFSEHTDTSPVIWGKWRQLSENEQADQSKMKFMLNGDTDD